MNKINKGKNKVLFIMHMPPPVHGAAMMGQYIHDSKLINESFECRYINPSASASVDEVGKIGVKKMLRTIKVVWKIFKTCIVWRPDLVYLTPTNYGRWYSGSLYLNIAYVLALKLTARKIVYHMHNKGVESSLKVQPSLKVYYKWMYKNVKVILLAKALYHELRDFVSEKDLYICPNGIPSNISVSSSQKCKLQKKVPCLLFLSNLIESKGVLVLLDALKKLKDCGENFVCNFVGGESVDIDTAIFENEVAQRNLSDKVFYLGRKYNQDKEAVYEEADIFVFPTFYPGECFPLVLLEAMQHRLPCVSTTEGGISEIIDEGKTGFVVERENVDALVDKLRVLIHNPELRLKMGNAGFEKFQKNLTLSCFEINLTKILSEICQQEKY